MIRPIGLELPDQVEVEVVEETQGGSGVDFGVPGSSPISDGRSVDADGATRDAAIVEAAWATFDGVAAHAPAELRKGPRGGGRDRDKMVGHVIEADWYYARELGLKARQPSAGRPRRGRGAQGRGARDPPPAVRTAARSPAGNGPLATPRDASPGTRSITPGRCRTAPRSGAAAFSWVAGS